jgi:hypothetical protein
MAMRWGVRRIPAFFNAAVRFVTVAMGSLIYNGSKFVMIINKISKMSRGLLYYSY